jgi:hypothetical protein
LLGAVLAAQTGATLAELMARLPPRCRSWPCLRFEQQAVEAQRNLDKASEQNVEQNVNKKYGLAPT